MNKEIKEMIKECAISALGVFATEIGKALTGMVVDKRTSEFADNIKKHMHFNPVTVPLNNGLGHDITNLNYMQGTGIIDCSKEVNNLTT